jgi:hypothetical protein
VGVYALGSDRVCGDARRRGVARAVRRVFLVARAGRDLDFVFLLKICGDKTSLSVAVVSLEKKEDYYDGRFSQALACDKLAINSNCIVNLQQHNPIYTDDYKIDLSTYNFLAIKTSDEIPFYASLRKDDLQDLTDFEYFPTINKLLKSTEWYKLGVLNDIWISSILTLDSNGKKLLYVITFIQAKETRELKCQEPTKYLSDFKHFILEQ